MKPKFHEGQIVRFKNYSPKENESEAYYVVVLADNSSKGLWLQVLNTNHYYQTGWTVCPIDANVFEVVKLKAKLLINEEVTIKEGLYQEYVFGSIHHASDPDGLIIFNKTPNGFESNIIFTMSEEIVKGKLAIILPKELL